VYFSPCHLEELRVIKGLVLLAGVDMVAPWCRRAFCGDACLSGFSLAEASLSHREVRDAARVRER